MPEYEYDEDDEEEGLDDGDDLDSDGE